MTISLSTWKSGRLWFAAAAAAALVAAGMLFAAAKPGAVEAQEIPASYVCEFAGAAGPLEPGVPLLFGDGTYGFDTEPDGHLNCTYTDGDGPVTSDGQIVSNGDYSNIVCGTGEAWSHPRPEDPRHDPNHGTLGTSTADPDLDVITTSYTITFIAGEGQLTVHHWENRRGESGTGTGVVRIAPHPGPEACLDEEGVQRFEVEGAFTLIEE